MHYRACRKAAFACLCFVAASGALAQIRAGAYRLGPGDQIRIAVDGEPELTRDLEVDEAGTVSYPFLGTLVVRGFTISQLEEEIRQGLEGPYLVSPSVAITVIEYRPFLVRGEVRNPGGIPYQPRLTIARAVMLAGGFAERASRYEIDVIRATDPSETPVDAGLSDPVFPGDIITITQGGL